MKIQDHHTGGVAAALSLPKGKGAEATAPQRSAAASDSLRLSDRSREIQRARSAALGAPDVRQELVDKVASLVATGQYDVSGAQVAPRMIREHLADAAR